MRVPAVVFLLAFVAMANSSLLEMSRTLWTKVLEGGLTKIGALDPLRVPVVKVDQSEGNTSYRMILRNVEIIGLNYSTLESVHIGRGRLKTNLSEYEAGYVSYTDQRELDTIRYRFHTVVKESKGDESQNLEVKAIPDIDNSKNHQIHFGGVRNYDGRNYEASSTYEDDRQRTVPRAQGSNYESSPKYQEDQQRTVPQDQRTNYDTSSRYQENKQRTVSQDQRTNYESSSRYQENKQRTVPQDQRTNYESSSRYQENKERTVPQDRRTSYESSSRYQESQQITVPQSQRSNYESSSRYQENRRISEVPQGRRSNYEASKTPEDQIRYYSQSQNSQRPSDDSKVEFQIPERQGSSAYASLGSSGGEQNARYAADGPGSVRVVYAERLRYPEDDSETKNQRPANARAGPPSCVGDCEYRKQEGHPGAVEKEREEMKTDGREAEIGAAASVNFASRRAYVDAGVSPGRSREDSVEGRIRYNDGPTDGNRYAANFERTSNNRGNTEVPSSRLENQAGYVDVVYAEGKDHKMRHFGNLRVEPRHDKNVYSLEDVLRDLRDHARFIVHNFTDGEALTKKNDAARTASETKRIKDMVRYAKEYQEKQGYYEQGMQLIYHYGDRDDDDGASEDRQAKRNKRAHLDEDAEDDVMHVIMRIRVPMLRVNAGYVLMGKVGKQALRGNGLLAGNFTEVIGDFTVEVKKVGEDTMMVRAARARLSAKDKNITLQGMDEEGPVKEILTHGLMAAEAVAAMLADDLATKALTEKTADSVIYRMYKNLPVENS